MFTDRDHRILAIACYSVITIALSTSAYRFITGMALLTILSIFASGIVFCIAFSVLFLSNIPDETKNNFKEDKLQILLSIFTVFKVPLLVTFFLLLLIVGGGIIVFIIVNVIF